MERSKRKSLRQWEKLVGEQARSGLSARRFCQAKSIGLASFYQWRRRLGDAGSGSEGGKNSGGRFIDMGQIDSSGSSTSTDGNSWVVTLDFGEGVKLTLQRG